MQTSYGITLIADVLLFDQVKMFILKATHSYLGNETKFSLWLFGFIFGILGKKQASYQAKNSHICLKIKIDVTKIPDILVKQNDNVPF